MCPHHPPLRAVNTVENPFVMRAILVFSLIASLAVSTLSAQQAKLGFVSDKDILNQMPSRNEVQKILDKETAIWEQRFQTRQSELEVYLDSLNTLNTELETLRASLDSTDAPAPADSAAADTVELAANVRRLSIVVETRKKELLAYYHRIYGKDGVLNRRNAELTQSILEKLHATIGDISKTLQLSVMLDASALLYIDQDYNYTEQVMEALNIGTQLTR